MNEVGRRAVAGAATLLLAVLSGCGGNDRPAAQPTPPATSAPAATPTPTGTRTPTAAVPITKVLVFMVENHSLDAMRREMPWTFAIAEKYGYATGYHAITHPSLPNYLAIAGGDTFGVTDDRGPGVHAVHARSVFGQALRRHRSAKAYAEDMATPCATYDHGQYAVRHNPWTFFADEHHGCGRYDVPMTELRRDVRTGGLPNVGLVAPNLCNDAHDCPAADADGWMRSVVGRVLAGPDYASGRLLVVITADEDHHDQGNLVLTALANPQLDHVVVRTPLDHYSLSGLLSEVVGARPLRHAQSAPSMATAFGLRLGDG